jgi:hypothetical protein
LVGLTVAGDVGDEETVAQVDGGRADIGVGRKVLLDLARLDPNPAELDLLIEATEELQGTVGSSSHPVARTIEAAPAMIEEAFGGELGLVKVSASKSFPGKPQLAGDSDRYRISMAVDNFSLNIRNRNSQRDGIVFDPVYQRR